MKDMLKEILAAAWERWRREFGRSCGEKIREEELDSRSDGREEDGRRFFGMMIQRQVMTRWEDDPIQIHVDGWGGGA